MERAGKRAVTWLPAKSDRDLFVARDWGAWPMRSPDGTALARLCLFWRLVSEQVRFASPLLDAVRLTEGVDLDELIWRIEPPPSWPARPLPGVRSTWRSDWPGRPADFSSARTRRRHGVAGVVTRGHAFGRDLLGLRFIRDGVELAVHGEHLRLETCGGVVRMRLGRSIPMSVAMVAVGRPVSDLVDHSWLRGTCWPILAIDASRRGCTLINFETGRAHWRLPWPHLPSTDPLQGDQTCS